MNTSLKGSVGEERAAVFLEEKGFRVIRRNFRLSGGEVDIVVVRADEIRFCEVKSWSTVRIDGLEYAVGPRKARRIRKCARVYLMQHPVFDTYTVSFDVLFVPPEEAEIVHLESVLESLSGETE